MRVCISQAIDIFELACSQLRASVSLSRPLVAAAARSHSTATASQFSSANSTSTRQLQQPQRQQQLQLQAPQRRAQSLVSQVVAPRASPRMPWPSAKEDFRTQVRAALESLAQAYARPDQELLEILLRGGAAHEASPLLTKEGTAAAKSGATTEQGGNSDAQQKGRRLCAARQEAAIYALNASGAYHRFKEQLKPSFVALLHDHLHRSAAAGGAANAGHSGAPQIKIDDRALSEVGRFAHDVASLLFLFLSPESVISGSLSVCLFACLSV